MCRLGKARAGLVGERWCAPPPPNNPNDIAHYTKTKAHHEARIFNVRNILAPSIAVGSTVIAGPGADTANRGQDLDREPKPRSILGTFAGISARSELSPF